MRIREIRSLLRRSFPGRRTPVLTLAWTSAAALLAWVVVLLMPSRPWSTRERIEPPAVRDADLAEVTVLIPARNEAASISRVLTALSRQGRNLHAIVVDDQSDDDTAAICGELARSLGDRLRIDNVAGGRLPEGWGGKLWALQQGLDRVERRFTLLLDADIELAESFVPALLEQARRDGRSMVSVMAELRCRSFWERLLVPPFIYFFKLIYPFGRVNDSSSRAAAAAGGCILIETAALRSIGGFGKISDALIDDCTLAAEIKSAGRSIWLGVSHSVLSLREYRELRDFSQMVTRTAFTQLRYSTVLLVLVTLAMGLVFIVPVAGLVACSGNAMPSAAVQGFDAGLVCFWASLAALLGMTASYLPMIRFYGLPAVWALTLPLAATLFLGMTWISALRYWRGVRAHWKGRDYETE